MREKMVAQMNAELEQTIRSDKTVLIVAIILNIVMISINTPVAVAAAAKAGLTLKLVLFVLTAFVVVLNVAVWFALASGKKRRVKIVERIGTFWEEEGLGKYQDATISSGYATRSSLFTIIVMAVGAVAFLIPTIVFFSSSPR